MTETKPTRSAETSGTEITRFNALRCCDPVAMRTVRLRKSVISYWFK